MDVGSEKLRTLSGLYSLYNIPIIYDLYIVLLHALMQLSGNCYYKISLETQYLLPKPVSLISYINYMHICNILLQKLSTQIHA